MQVMHVPCGGSGLNLERSANHPGSILHDVQPHPMIGRVVFLEAGAVVGDRERTPSVFGDRRMTYAACLPVFDGIVDGFLRDVIEMRGHGVVMDQHRRIALEAAGDPKQILHFAGPTLERGHETVRVGHNGQKAARQLPRLMDRLVHKLHDLGGVGGSVSAAFLRASAS